MSKISYKKSLLAGFLIFLCFFSCIAQTDKKVNTSISGAAMVSTDANGSVFFNLGGPMMKVSHKKWFATVNMFPSLRFFDVKGTLNVNPILGAGMTLGYKRWMIGFPCYYLLKKDVWVFSVGAGVSLGK